MKSKVSDKGGAYAYNVDILRSERKQVRSDYVGRSNMVNFFIIKIHNKKKTLGTQKYPWVLLPIPINPRVPISTHGWVIVGSSNGEDEASPRLPRKASS